MTEDQRKREEALEAAQLAALVAANMKQVDSMTARGSSVSKARPIDPRSFVKNVPGVGAKLKTDIGGDDALKPRIQTIPLPQGVSPTEIIPPEMKEIAASMQPTPISAPAPAPQDNQLELNFNRQATLNEIFSHLETLNSKLDTVLYVLKKIETNASNTTISEDKKKSNYDGAATS